MKIAVFRLSLIIGLSINLFSCTKIAAHPESSFRDIKATHDKSKKNLHEMEVLNLVDK